MALHENTTEKIQELMKNSPLQSITDQRVTNLNQLLNYFKAWKQTFHRRTDV